MSIAKGLNLRPIPCFPGYLADRKGNVYSQWRRTQRNSASIVLGYYHLLKPGQQAGGYLHVSLLREDGKRVNVRIHRAVLLAFRGPPSDGQEASHLDGNPENNALANLIWETRQKNHQRKFKHGTAQGFGAMHHRAVLTQAQANEMRRLRQVSRMTHEAIARRFRVSRTTVSRVLNNQRYI